MKSSTGPCAPTLRETVRDQAGRLESGGVAAGLGLCAAVVLVHRLPYLFVPQLDWDEGTRMSIASALNHGRTLYVSAWDHHTFLDILFFQLLFKVFPVEWAPVAVRLSNLLIVLALCALVFRAVGLISQSRSWALGAALVAGYLFSQPWALSSHGEFYHSLPVAGAFYIGFLRPPGPGWRAAAGALLATGFFIKQTALFDAAAFLGLLAVSRFVLVEQPPAVGPGPDRGTRIRLVLGELGWVGLGAVLVGAGAAAYFLHQGALREAVYMTFVDPVIYATGTDVSSTVSSYAAAATRMLDYAAGVSGFVTVGTALSLACLWWAMLRNKLETREQAWALGAGIWLGIDMAGLVSIGRFYPHYLAQLVVPASIFCTYFLSRLRRPLLELGLGVAVVSLAAVPLIELGSKGRTGVRTLDPETLEQTVQFVRRNTAEGDHIYLYQNWALCLYYLTERFPPGKVFMDHQLLPENKDAPKLLEETLSSLSASPPELVIRGGLGRSVPEIEQFIRTQYGPLTNYGSHEIWGRRP